MLRIASSEINKVKPFNAISSAVAYTNKDHRKLSLMATIDKKFSCHSARHSWEVRALQKRMGIEYVSKLMRHSSVKQTEVSVQILHKELDKAMEIFNETRKETFPMFYLCYT